MTKKSKKSSRLNIAIVATLSILILGLIVFVLYSQANSKPTTEEINKALGCDRNTLDSRQTDVFCDNKELVYKEDLTFEDFAKDNSCQGYLAGEISKEDMNTYALKICQVYKQYQEYLKYFPETQTEAKAAIEEYKK